MSNPLAIAAVTATLRNLLAHVADPFPGEPDSNLHDTQITTLPLDKAGQNSGRNEINLFMYQTLYNPTWRNIEPMRSRPGESGPSAVALNLGYLLTAYGRDNDEVLSHRLLGRAMALLADNAVLSPTNIAQALAGNDLHQQPERVRLSPQVLSTEEMSKLWTMLQSKYRPSVAYQVSVVLLDSALPIKAPLPVLRRSLSGSGASVQLNVVPPFPALTALAPPNGQPSARLGPPDVPSRGDVLSLAGHHLSSSDGQPVVRFRHTLRKESLQLTDLIERSANSIRIRLPDAASDLPAGSYLVSVSVLDASGAIPTSRETNAIPFSLSPRIYQLHVEPAVEVSAGPTLTVRCTPPVWPGQRVSILIGDREIPMLTPAQKTDVLTFALGKISTGDYLIRLRVDGIDSLVVDYTTTPPSFDETQRVKL